MEIVERLAFLIASVLFMVGLKLMARPDSAARGNRISAIAMAIAILATLAQTAILTLPEIMGGLVAGGVIGLLWARQVKMTEMPEMVALFNGLGGLASLLVGLSDYWSRQMERNLLPDWVALLAGGLAILVGGVTFSGSLMAWGKLSGRVNGGSVTWPGQHLINLILLVASLVLCGLLVPYPEYYSSAVILMVIALVLGVTTVLPIGGADMPVVISLLNSYSGIAACWAGFVVQSEVLIITGALVGASGIILTQIMCKAMNRSLLSVMAGGFGSAPTAAGQGGSAGSGAPVKSTNVEETAMILQSASLVIVVPGYGMAVAQAQHAVREMAEMLEENGTEVLFAIHPVAGRMPGHMNVLLAEADISYDKLLEMEKINSRFAEADVCLVLGANDVVNPAARNDPSSPIYGMPILDADKARTVIVSKRSMSAGYAGIENGLFNLPNTLMLFGDSKKTLGALVEVLREG